jgi:hypothetical protein
MAALLRVVALLGGLAGLTSLSNATMGVGIICFACLLAILARMSQADAHQRELKSLLEKRPPS